MSSWRDTASPQAQHDLDQLLNTALGFAQHELATRGEFFPYAVAIGADGSAEMIAARPDRDDEQPRSSDVIESSVAALVRIRDEVQAGAVVSDVRIPDDGDAIQVDLEHSEGAALRILLPYTKKRFGKDVEYGPIRAERGQRRIWA